MDDIMTVFEVMSDVYDTISKIDNKIAFQALIGTIIDQWSADHELEQDEVFEMTQQIADTQRLIYESLGMMERSK